MVRAFAERTHEHALRESEIEGSEHGELLLLPNIVAHRAFRAKSGGSKSFSRRRSIKTRLEGERCGKTRMLKMLIAWNVSASAGLAEGQNSHAETSIFQTH